MKRLDARLSGVLAVALALGGCVGPTAPSPGLAPPPVSPGAMSADMQCRQYANAQTEPMRQQTNANTVGSTLLGGALGAGLGAAVGGGRGAAIGAASGGLVGAGVGASNAQYSAAAIQQQYDAIYAQCMSGQGGPPPGYPPPGYAPPPYPGQSVPPPPPRY